ncbi:MAG: hypothetical protein WC364_11045 [Eubacteriales bacterium]|jgi:ribosomal protein L37AE/L43A
MNNQSVNIEDYAPMYGVEYRKAQRRNELEVQFLQRYCCPQENQRAQWEMAKEAFVLDSLNHEFSNHKRVNFDE